MNQGVLCSGFQEFFEIEVNHHAVAFGDVMLRLGHCLVGGTRPIVFGDERWCDLTPSHDTPIYLANRENFPIWITHLVWKGRRRPLRIGISKTRYFHTDGHCSLFEGRIVVCCAFMNWKNWLSLNSNNLVWIALVSGGILFTTLLMK
jgi:hypothetical protein